MPVAWSIPLFSLITNDFDPVMIEKRGFLSPAKFNL